MKAICIKEHDYLYRSEEEQSELYSILEDNNVELYGLPHEYMGEPKCLGVSAELQASYYVGATWLIEGKCSLVVRPKIKDIDIAQMLITALSVQSQDAIKYFSKCYKIQFDEQKIETFESQSELTPLLIISYIQILESLVRTGLKKDYVTVTDNLKGKIKGHLLLRSHIRDNVIPKREDRNHCKYQIYTDDIPCNRLLKKALLFSKKMLQVYMSKHKQYSSLSYKISKLERVFENVSSDVVISEVRSNIGNKIFKHYGEATKLAKDILHRYDYSISNIDDTTRTTYPFWIDMSRLFEMYVLSLLKSAYCDNVDFQVEGYSQVADYIHKSENLILDAKYKKVYNSQPKASEIIDDIREISGNARDVKITNKLINSNDEPSCIILYPSSNGIDYFHNKLFDIAQKQPIRQFRKFYKIGIKLPVI